MFDLSKEQKYIIVVLVLILLGGVAYGVYNRLYKPSDPEVLAGEPDVPFSQFKLKSIVIHLSGAVKREGVFRLKEGARLLDAINLAGGLLPQADIALVNLAEEVKDGSKIIIPPKRGLSESVSNVGFSGPPLSLTLPGGLININAADEKDLMKIPGVGEVTAGRIIEHRRANGPFGKIEDLRGVKGIGPKKFEKMKALVTVN